MAPRFLFLNEQEIRVCVAVDHKALAAVEEGFTRLANGDAVVPEPMGIRVPEREADVHIKTAYVRGMPGFAVKIASGFSTNAARGLATSSGMMILLSAETGFPMALLLDNYYLTEVRTAVAGAIAAKYLARASLRTVGVLGAGSQGRFQIEGLRLVRSFDRLLVWDRRPDAVRGFCEEMSKRLGIDVVGAASASQVVRGSDLVVTATPAREPLVRAVDLHEGLHITAMGSDGPGKQELEPQVLERADRLVCDRKAQCLRLGELQHGLAAGLLNEQSAIAELGELTSGAKPGRTNEREITVCDLTGVGVQDTSIACLAYAEARAKGLGRETG